MPRTVASLDLAAATFDVGGRTGAWQSVTPSFEWGFRRRLSVFGALPLAHVAYDGGQSAWGIGDLALSAKVALYETPHGGFLLSAGLGAELPTGDDDGLGGGHVEVSPFVAASTVLHEGTAATLIAYALTSFRWSVGDGGHHHAAGIQSHADLHGSVLAPHGERELFGRLMGAAVLGSFYLAAGAEGAAVVHGAGVGQLAPRAELGWRMTPKVRVFVAGEITALGERRYGTRARGGVAWIF